MSSVRALREELIRLAVPFILASLTVPLVGLVDTAVLGHLDSPHHLAGVALGSILFDLIWAVFGFLRISTTGLYSQSEGAGDHKEAGLVAMRSLWLALGLGIVLWLLQWPLAAGAFSFLQAEPEVTRAGMSYFHARILVAPLTLMNFATLGILQGMGRARTLLLMAAVTNAVNIVFDVLFVTKLGWGAAGAGWATSLGHAAGWALGMSVLLPTLPWRTRLGTLLKTHGWGRLFSLSRDIIIRSLALVGAMSYVTAQAAAMGTLLLAANTILLKWVSLGSFVIDGFAMAASRMTGREFGAGRPGMVLQITKLGIRWGMVCAGLFVAWAMFWPAGSLELLTDQPAILAVVDDYRWWLAPVMLLGSVAYVLDGVFNGLTLGKDIRNAMVVSAGLGFFPVAWWAGRQGDNHLLWVALCLLMGMRIVTYGLRLPKALNPAT